MSLHYTKDIFDRSTGELVTLDLGLWMTLKEFTDLMGVPMKLGRAVLQQIGLVGLEGGRLRLKQEHVEGGLGRRNKTKASKFPFDVLSPAGQHHARPLWDKALWVVLEERGRDREAEEADKALQSFMTGRFEAMTTQMEVSWLQDHYPGLSTRSIARLLHVSEAIVFKWSAHRQRQLREAATRKVMALA